MPPNPFRPPGNVNEIRCLGHRWGDLIRALLARQNSRYLLFENTLLVPRRVGADAPVRTDKGFHTHPKQQNRRIAKAIRLFWRREEDSPLGRGAQKTVGIHCFVGGRIRRPAKIN